MRLKCLHKLTCYKLANQQLGLKLFSKVYFLSVELQVNCLFYEDINYQQSRDSVDKVNLSNYVTRKNAFRHIYQQSTF